MASIAAQTVGFAAPSHKLKGEPLAQETAAKSDVTILSRTHSASSAPWSSLPLLQLSISLEYPSQRHTIHPHRHASTRRVGDKVDFSYVAALLCSPLSSPAQVCAQACRPVGPVMRVTEMLMEQADVEPRTTLITGLSRQPALMQLERMKRNLPRRDRSLTPRVAVVDSRGALICHDLTAVHSDVWWGVPPHGDEVEGIVVDTEVPMGAGLRLVLYDRRWSRNELRKSLQAYAAVRRRALGKADEGTTKTVEAQQQQQQLLQQRVEKSDDSEASPPTRTSSRVERLARAVNQMMPTMAPTGYRPGGEGGGERAAGKESAALLYAGGTSAEEASIFAAALPGVSLAGGFLQVHI